MITMGEVDTSNLTMIITWAIDISFRSPILKWTSWTHTKRCDVMIIYSICTGIYLFFFYKASQWSYHFRNFTIRYHQPEILLGLHIYFTSNHNHKQIEEHCWDKVDIITIRAWTSDYVYCFIWGIITHPYRNFNGRVVGSRHEWIITSRNFTWIYLLIRVLNSTRV